MGFQPPPGLQVSVVTPEPLLGTGGHHRHTGGSSGSGGELAREPQRPAHGSRRTCLLSKGQSSTCHFPRLGQRQQCLREEGRPAPP